MKIIIHDDGVLKLSTDNSAEYILLNVLYDINNKPLVFEKQTSGVHLDEYIATPITIVDVNKKQFDLNLITEVIAHLAKREKLAACKMLMNVAGLGLREAKGIADAWTDEIMA